MLLTRSCEATANASISSWPLDHADLAGDGVVTTDEFKCALCWRLSGDFVSAN